MFRCDDTQSSIAYATIPGYPPPSVCPLQFGRMVDRSSAHRLSPFPLSSVVRFFQQSYSLRLSNSRSASHAATAATMAAEKRNVCPCSILPASAPGRCGFYLQFVDSSFAFICSLLSYPLLKAQTPHPNSSHTHMHAYIHMCWGPLNSAAFLIFLDSLCHRGASAVFLTSRCTEIEFLRQTTVPPLAARRCRQY